MNSLNDLRENGRIDISNGIRVQKIAIDEIELAGARNKFWFNNYKFLFKEIYDNSYEDYAELISFEFANLLGIPCAKYDLGIYNGKYGVITENIVNEDDGDELISGTEIINFVYQNHIQKIKRITETHNHFFNNLKEEKNNIIDVDFKKEYLQFVKEMIVKENIDYKNFAFLEQINSDEISESKLEQLYKECCYHFNDLQNMYSFDITPDSQSELKINNLFDLWSIIDVYCKLNGFDKEDSTKIIKDLLNIQIYDMLTLQGDRHTDNWSLILNKKYHLIKMAPIYDNSNMCNLNRINVINNIYSQILSTNSVNINLIKKDRINQHIMAQIYHIRSLLGIYPENNYMREKNLDIAKQFLSTSDDRSIDLFERGLKILNEENLVHAFNNIKVKTNTEVPEIVKLVVSKSIETNVLELSKIYTGKDEVKK